MSERSRRALAVFAVVAAVLIAWLALRPSNDDGATLGDATGGGTTNGPTAKWAIDAEEERDDVATSLRPWNRETAKVTGLVRDESGRPISGAAVCASIQSDDAPAERRYVPKCTSSAADGRYMLDPVIAVDMTVSASAATYIPAMHRATKRNARLRPRPRETLENIDIELKSGGVLVSGIVKDVAGGVVEGAQVTSGAWSWSDNRGLSLTMSDADGIFELWVAPGDAYIVASADGYANGSQFGVSPGFSFEILLTPESSVGGRVVDAATGKPVPDARVEIKGARQLEGRNVTYSDDGGRFRIAKLEPGRYTVSASTLDRYGEGNESRRVGLGEAVEDIEVRVFPAASISGEIVVADGSTACEGGGVSVRGRVTKHAVRESADRDGRVTVSGLPPDTYDVQVSCANLRSRPSYEPVVVAETPVDSLVWEVDRGISLHGVVVDSNGKPIEGATVNGRQTDVLARGQPNGSWDVKSAKDGRFELDGLVPGTYDVEASHADHVSPEKPTSHVLTADSTERVTITMLAGGSVRGRVIDAKQRPVSGAEVQVIGDRWGPSSQTADDGTFTIASVRVGDHRVTASTAAANMRAPGTTDDDVQGERVSVRAGEVTVIELVVEEQFGTVSGRVVDADGGPVDDAFVSFSRETDSAKTTTNRAKEMVRWNGWTQEPVLTDVTGAFILESVPTGTHTLFAQRKGGGEGLVEHIESDSTGVVIRLSEGASIAGTVVLAGGGSPDRYTIMASDGTQGIRRTESFFRTAGEWRVSGLPPGKYDITVSATEGQADATVELKDASKDGVRLELVPRVDVSGLVVDLETGDPIPGMLVSMSPAKGQSGFSMSSVGDQDHITDDAGKFIVRGAPSGRVRITIISRTLGGGNGKTYGWGILRASVPSDVATFGLPTIRLAARRIGRGERGGDLGYSTADTPTGSDYEDVPLTVAVIRPGGPAAKTELKVGDEIVEVDGHDVTGDNRHVYAALANVKAGTSVTIGLRDGQKVTIVAGKPI